MKKILSITTLYSPFQIDVVNAFQQSEDVSFHVAFTMLNSQTRGKHWRNSNSLENQYIHSIDSDGDLEYKMKWVSDLIDKIKPTHIVLGLWRAPLSRKVTQLAKKNGIKVGYWMEPPNFLLSKPIQFVLNQMAKYLVKDADYFLCIGDRCENIYRNILDKKDKVFFLSYGQDLTEFDSLENKTFDEPIKFLFSGQLISRHNISWICDAIGSLNDEYKGRFKFIFAAKGVEQSYIDALLAKKTELSECISFDCDYEHWSDRVRPFKDSHVLVYPTSHSGWGLVIPEAMAAGVIVLSTRKAEAARYYVRHDINGRIIPETKDGLLQAMKHCLDHPADMERLSLQARLDSHFGSSDYVSGRLHKIFKDYI